MSYFRYLFDLIIYFGLINYLKLNNKIIEGFKYIK